MTHINVLKILIVRKCLKCIDSDRKYEEAVKVFPSDLAELWHFNPPHSSEVVV